MASSYETHVQLHSDRIDNPSADPAIPLFAPKLHLQKRGTKSIELDLCNAHAAFANAIRRTLLASLPSVAVENVAFETNTSIMHDEILAHRLGLVPIRCDPAMMEYKYKDKSGGDTWTDRDTIVFKLDVKCSEKPGASPTAELPEDKYINHNVYSGDMKWMPHGDQLNFFPDGVDVVESNILLLKLRPGQHVKAELLCVKGWGGDHAKFSPVATAFYRILPVIEISRPIVGDDAIKFQSCFPKGVISLVTNAKGEKEAKVANARDDTVSRECLRHPEFQDKVHLSRKRDHFIFNVTGNGSVPPHVLFADSLKYLVAQAYRVKQAVDEAVYTVDAER